MFNKNDILLKMYELQKNRRNLIDKSIRLEHNDIKRIVNNINSDPFDEKECCLWNGYITKSSNSNYINFFFKGRKLALHRVLFLNYKDNLDEKSYLKYTCNNKGICCNINHIIKCNNEIKEIIIDNNKYIEEKKDNINILDNNNIIKINKLLNNVNRTQFIIIFDE